MYNKFNLNEIVRLEGRLFVVIGYSLDKNKVWQYDLIPYNKSLIESVPEDKIQEVN